MTDIAVSPSRPVLTVAEVATMLGVSRWLVQQAARTGELPSIRLGRRILFPRIKIEALVRGDDTDLDEPATPTGPTSRGRAAYPQPASYPQTPSTSSIRPIAG